MLNSFPNKAVIEIEPRPAQVLLILFDLLQILGLKMGPRGCSVFLHLLRSRHRKIKEAYFVLKRKGSMIFDLKIGFC